MLPQLWTIVWHFFAARIFLVQNLQTEQLCHLYGVCKTVLATATVPLSPTRTLPLRLPTQSLPASVTGSPLAASSFDFGNLLLVFGLCLVLVDFILVGFTLLLSRRTICQHATKRSGRSREELVKSLEGKIAKFVWQRTRRQALDARRAMKLSAKPKRQFPDRQTMTLVPTGNTISSGTDTSDLGTNGLSTAVLEAQIVQLEQQLQACQTVCRDMCQRSLFQEAVDQVLLALPYRTEIAQLGQVVAEQQSVLEQSRRSNRDLKSRIVHLTREKLTLLRETFARKEDLESIVARHTATISQLEETIAEKNGVIETLVPRLYHMVATAERMRAERDSASENADLAMKALMEKNTKVDEVAASEGPGADQVTVEASPKAVQREDTITWQPDTKSTDEPPSSVTERGPRSEYSQGMFSSRYAPKNWADSSRDGDKTNSRGARSNGTPAGTRHTPPVGAPSGPRAHPPAGAPTGPRLAPPPSAPRGPRGDRGSGAVRGGRVSWGGRGRGF